MAPHIGSSLRLFVELKAKIGLLLARSGRPALEAFMFQGATVLWRKPNKQDWDALKFVTCSAGGKGGRSI